MTSEILSLAKYLAASRLEFSLSEMNQYLSKGYKEKELFEILKMNFFNLNLYCSPDHKCSKIVKTTLPSDEAIVKELEEVLKHPGLPLRIEKLVNSYIEHNFGKNWSTGDTGRLIRENIVSQKEEYWKGEGGSVYPRIRIVSYLLYHFPVYFCQYQRLLFELFKSGLLFNKMKIIDAGSGPGTISLSTIDFFRKLQDIYSRNNMDVKLSIRFGSIENELENIVCYKELIKNYLSGSGDISSNIIMDEPVRSSIENAPIPKDADLIVFSNVLAELKSTPPERANVVERIASSSKDPTLIIIEPADLDNSKALRITQQTLVRNGFYVYGPCSFMWGRTCTGNNCWSFRELGDISAPDFMKRIADTADSYRYMNIDMKFSYVILRKDGISKHNYHAKGKFMALSNLKMHIEKHINVAASVMSENLGNEKILVFKICDGTAREPCYAIMPVYHMSENNRELSEAGYGDIVEIFGVLVRENKNQSSINLLVTRNTIVRIAD
ncbi:MAG: hypothetical protein OIN87_03020 [Candidatus Methanoperedens sp.]|nr:hypothetical protein [Candidatus Methanoperedens sp.]